MCTIIISSLPPNFLTQFVFAQEKKCHTNRELIDSRPIPACPKEKPVIKNANNAELELMAKGLKCAWENVGKNLEIKMPEYDANLPLENNYTYCT